MQRKNNIIIGFSALLASLPLVKAEDLFTPGDPIIAIDSIGGPSSGYPVVPTPTEGESAENVLDSDSSTKYLNFGKEQSGFIVTPAIGSSVVQSMVLVTANDFAPRDPATFVLYGTNDPIISEDRSRGDLENWTEIASGDTMLPTDRLTPGAVIEISNSTAYTSYRLVFDTLRDSPNANSVQIADVSFYDQPAAAGTSIIAAGDPILSIDTNQLQSESPNRILDGDPTTKYLNQGDENSGFIITPGTGSSVVKSMSLVTANDFETRDPASYSLYGTNDAIVSTDNSFGDGENWTLISSGDLALPADRFTEAPIVDFDNDTAYTSYRLIFDTIKDVAAGAMQIADVQFYTEAGGSGTEIFSGNDPILAVDFDLASTSGYPAAESPAFAIDGTTSKYLNVGGQGTGFVITPSVGETIVESFTITTANDAEGRDPLNYSIYGTNDPVTLTDNALSTDEGWDLIQEGTLTLPAERNAVGDTVPVTNSNSYTSYRVVFDNLKNDNELMQIGEIQFDGIIGAGGAPEFTSIEYLANSDSTTLVWLSAADRTYSLFYSTDLVNWELENDSITSGGESTTYSPGSSDVKGLSKVFFRVVEN